MNGLDSETLGRQAAELVIAQRPLAGDEAIDAAAAWVDAQGLDAGDTVAFAAFCSAYRQRYREIVAASYGTGGHA